MNKKIKLHNAAKRTIAALTIVSMTVTGIGMMDSSAFNGVLSGNGLLSGDGTLSGNGTISGNADLSGDAVMSGDVYWEYDYNNTGEDLLANCLNESTSVRKIGESYSSATGPSIYDVVLETQTDAENDVKKQYKSYSDVKVSSSFLKVTSIKNLTYKSCFVNVLYCAKKNGAWVYEYDKEEGKWKGGTYNAKTYKIINDYYKMKKEKLFGVYDPTPQYDYIKDRLEAGKSVLGHFEVLKPNGKVDGHCMNINGILYVKVRYRNSSKDSYKSKNVIYYVVNDGWHNCDSGNYRIQYINSKYIDTMTCFGPVS